MTHRLQISWKKRLQNLIPFACASHRTSHFRDLAQAAWKNRDHLRYAWKILSQTACDGCALGSAGFRDWTLPGLHLCHIRLGQLRLSTMPALDETRLSDLSLLQDLEAPRLRALGRLRHPLLREKGDKGFRRLSWTEALQRAAQGIRSSQPERVGFFLGWRSLTNEVCYMAQKVARFLGTNNLDNAASLSSSSGSGAMRYALGVAAATCGYKDWLGTDLVVLFGAKPGSDQPLTLKYLRAAKRLGTKVGVVGPGCDSCMSQYPSPGKMRGAASGNSVADYGFPVAPGGDTAFLYGVLKIILKNGWHNQDWINRHADGFAELRQHVHTLDWATLEKRAGLGWRSMEELAELIRDAPNAVLVWGRGITKHPFGGDTVSMILNLGLARGYVGRPQCGFMPLHGDASLPGPVEMGAQAILLPGGKPINSHHLGELRDRYGFGLPTGPGLTAAEMIEAAGRGSLDVLYSLGGDLLGSMPDAETAARALGNIPIRVQQDTLLTEQAMIEPKQQLLLLPSKSVSEQAGGGTQTSTERRVIFTPCIPRPPAEIGQAREAWLILRELAAAAYPERAHLLQCETSHAIRREIARVVPAYEGIEHLETCGDAFQHGGPLLCAGDTFPTADGKAHFRIAPLPAEDELPQTTLPREEAQLPPQPERARAVAPDLAES